MIFSCGAAQLDRAAGLASKVLGVNPTPGSYAAYF